MVFLRSVFIFVGGLPPSTVPTTRTNKSITKSAAVKAKSN
jgi:hypothetical protein